MSPDPSRWPGEMVLSKRSGIVLLLRDDDVGSGNFDLAGSYHTKSKSETIKAQRTRGRWSHRTHQLCCNQPTTVERRSGGSFVDLAARPEGGVGDALRPLGVTFMPPSPVLAGAAPRSPRSAAREGGHRQTGKACPFEALVNPGRPRPPQTTRRGHRVAEQLLGAHRRPFWARSGGKVLGAFGGDPHKLDDLRKYLLLHDVHTRPVRAPPTGLAADIPSGCLELELLQEIPVI